MAAKRKPLFGEFAECNGLGTLYCYCGGDLCVCGLDGQECFGCEKCEDRGDDDYDEPEQPPTK